jgi:hypothetical protein
VRVAAAVVASAAWLTTTPRPAAAEDVAVFRCGVVPPGTVLRVTASSLSPGVAPVPSSCAHALAVLLNRGFTLAAAAADEHHVHFTMIRPPLVLPGLETDVVTLRCVPGGGGATIPATHTSNSPGAPAVAAGTDCATALVAVLGLRFRLEQALAADEGALHYVLVRRRPAVAPGLAVGKAVILRCVAGGGDPTIPVTDSSHSPGAPLFPPFATNCADAVASLLSAGYDLPATLMDGPGALYYTLTRP